MHTSSGLLKAIAASTITLEEAGQATLEFITQHVPEARTMPLLRQLDRHRPALPRRAPPRDRGAPPLSLRGRVHHQGAHAALVSRRARRRCPARPPPTGRSTTSASRSRSCAGTVPTCSSRVPPQTGHLTTRSSRFRSVDTTPATGRPRRQEQEPASTEVTEVAPNILRSQLPISLPGLGHVNCYLLQDERGVAVVDPGLPGPQSWRALVDRLKQAGTSPSRAHRGGHPLAPRPLRRGRTASATPTAPR